MECQEGRARPLILSEFAGSYSYSGFRSCLAVNPWDTRMTAQAIYQALTMDDDEAQTRWRDLHSHVVTQTAQAFVTSFLTRCLRVHLEHQHQVDTADNEGNRALVPALDVAKVIPRYRHSQKRLILVDFEATLWIRDIQPQMKYNPPPEALEILRALARNEKNDVWLLSGLAITDYLDRVAKDVPNIGIWYVIPLLRARFRLSQRFSAENGCFIKPRPINGKEQPWVNTVANFNLSWKGPCIEILQYVGLPIFCMRM